MHTIVKSEYRLSLKSLGTLNIEGRFWQIYSDPSIKITNFVIDDLLQDFKGHLLLH